MTTLVEKNYLNYIIDHCIKLKKNVIIARDGLEACDTKKCGFQTQDIYKLITANHELTTRNLLIFVNQLTRRVTSKICKTKV